MDRGQSASPSLQRPHLDIFHAHFVSRFAKDVVPTNLVDCQPLGRLDEVRHPPVRIEDGP